VGLLTAGVVLAIMIIPFIYTISAGSVPFRAALHERVCDGPGSDPHGKWCVLSYFRSRAPALSGLFFLALGRALGETMAVTMVIGNVPQIAKVAAGARVYHGRTYWPMSLPRRHRICMSYTLH